MCGCKCRKSYDCIHRCPYIVRHAVKEHGLRFIGIFCSIQCFLENLTLFFLFLFGIINDSFGIHDHGFMILTMNRNRLSTDPMRFSIPVQRKLMIFIFMLVSRNFLQILNTEPFFIFFPILLINLFCKHGCQFRKLHSCRGNAFFTGCRREQFTGVFFRINPQYDCFCFGIGRNNHLLFICIFILKQFQISMLPVNKQHNQGSKPKENDTCQDKCPH